MVVMPLKQANKRIFKAVLSLASAALLVRIIGMFNQVVVSDRFGAGASMDAYLVAYTTPALIALLIITAIEASVIPAHSRVRVQGSKEQASRLFSTLLNLLFVSTALLTILMLVFRRQITFFSAPGLDQFRLELAVSLAPFMYPMVVLMAMVGLLECILNAENQFGWPAYAGLLVPLATLILVLLVSRPMGVIALCIGTIVGLCLQLCAFVVRVRRARLIYRPIIDLNHPEIAVILATGWPALLGALINQASPLVDQIFASSLSTGSISALNYSLKIISVFSGVIFTSVGRAALPYLSQQAGAKDMNAFKETLRFYWWIVGGGMLVASLLLIVLAYPIVQLLFQHGAFSKESTNLTATTLVGFAVGLPAMALGILTSRAFSALNKTRVFVGVSIFSVLSNAVFDYIFARFWQSQGIALATSGVYFCTMIINFFMLRRYIGNLDIFKPPAELLKVIRKGKLVMNSYYRRWSDRKDENSTLPGVTSNLWMSIVRLGLILTVFAVGIAGVFINASYTLRIAIGSIVMLALLRYQYMILVIWLLSMPIIGAFPILGNNNIQTILTVPTLLLLTGVPVMLAFRRMPALAFLFCFLLWALAGIGLSPIGLGAFLILWVSYLNYLALAVLTICLLTTKQRLLRLIDVILLASAFIALLTIYSYVTHGSGALITDDGTFRVALFFNAAPTLSLFLSLVVPLAIYSVITSKGFKRYCYLLLVLILLGAIVLTFTRGTFISVPLSLIVMIFLLPSRKMKIALSSSIVLLAVLIIFLQTMVHFPILDRFFSDDLATLNGRAVIWQAVLSNFDPLQLLGKGLNASGVLVSTLDISNGLGGVAASSHNLFISILYDHGIIGLILFMGMFVMLGGNMIVKMRKATGDHRVLYAAVLAIFINVLIQSFETSDILSPDIGNYFWIILALPFALCWSITEQR